MNEAEIKLLIFLNQNRGFCHLDAIAGSLGSSLESIKDIVQALGSKGLVEIIESPDAAESGTDKKIVKIIHEGITFIESNPEMFG